MCANNLEFVLPLPPGELSVLPNILKPFLPLHVLLVLDPFLGLSLSFFLDDLDALARGGGVDTDSGLGGGLEAFRSAVAAIEGEDEVMFLGFSTARVKRSEASGVSLKN